MADYRTMYDSQYLYFVDLKGRDVTVTISEVRCVSVVGEGGRKARKPILFFKEAKDQRGYVLPKTMARIVAQLYGDDTDKWVGKRVTLFPSVTDLGKQKNVPCIRIRPEVPKTKTAGEFAAVEERPAPEAPDLTGPHEREAGQEG